LKIIKGAVTEMEARQISWKRKQKVSILAIAPENYLHLNGNATEV
jgi:hypothetical protein